jgi:hypothetical protein
MGLFDKYKQQSALNRLQEEQLFAFVLEELQNGQKKPGLYAQALVEAEGDEKKSNAAYIKLRVQSLKDEYTIDQLAKELYKQSIELIKQEPEQEPEPNAVYSVLVSPLLNYTKTPTVIHFITDIGTDLKKGEIVFTLRHTSNDEEFNVRATSNLKMVKISKKTGDTVSAAGQSICEVQLT